MQVIWLASYPKSGNTWVRFLIYAYLYGEIRSSVEVAAQLPDLHKVEPNSQGTFLLKTHGVCNSDHLYIDQTIGAIYVMRHPKDVLLSSYNWSRMEGENIAIEEYANEFIDNLGAPKWRKVGYGNWAENVESWLSEPRKRGFPLLCVRYEDLKRNPNETFGRIVRFLGMELEPSRLQRSIDACTFDRLSELEKTEKSNNIFSPMFSTGLGDAPGFSFMNKGQTGQALSGIASTMDEKFDSRFADLLARYGYS